MPYSDEVRVFMTYFYTEIKSLELKEFFNFISHPPIALHSEYQNLYTTNQPLTLGNYEFSY